MWFLLAVSAVSIPLLTIPGAALAIPYADAPLADYGRVLAFSLPWMTLVALMSYGIIARALVPVQEWLDSGGGTEGAARAWNVAVIRLPRVFPFAVGLAMLLAVVPAVYGARQVGLDTFGGEFATVAVIVIFMAAAGALHYLLWEEALRPLIADIARSLPRAFEPQAGSPSFSSKLLALILIMNLFTGTVAAGFSTDSVGTAGKVAIGAGTAVAISLTLALGLTLLLRRSFSIPLAALLRSMDSVREGDLNAELPPTSADEIAEVRSNFNSMLEGLQEREQLAQENARLQERIRAQLEEVRASRARIVAAGDAERRRVERELHDGAQQRFAAVALKLRMLEGQADTEPELQKLAADAAAELRGALAELGELTRGVHPQVLTTGGLAPALEQLAERMAVPVSVSVSSERYSQGVESTAYFVASEALANVEHHSDAHQASILAERDNGLLRVTISDDGVGGAEPDDGSDLAGLADRVAALDGELSVDSPTGGGTRVTVELPLRGAR